MRKILVIKIVIFLAVLQVWGCSARGLLLSNAKFFVVRAVDDFFDLDNRQEADIAKIYDRQVVNFRQKFLPEFYEWGDDLVRFVSQSQSQEHLLELLSRLEGVRRRFLLATMDDVGGFFVSIRDDQWLHFEMKLKESNEEIQEDLEMTDKDYAVVRRKKSRQMLMRWFGDLGQQEAPILGTFIFSKEWGRRNLAARISFQKNLIAAIRRSGKSKAAHKEWLQGFAESQDLFYGEEFKPLIIERRDRFMTSFRRLVDLLSNEQREHFRGAIQSLKEDLKRI